MKANVKKYIEGVEQAVAEGKLGRQYVEQDNFTICVLTDGATGNFISVGASKRNPNCDEPNPERANSIAFVRAAQTMMKVHKPKAKKKK